MNKLLIIIYLSNLVISLFVSEFFWYTMIGKFINWSNLCYLICGMIYDFMLLLLTIKIIYPLIVKYVVKCSKYKKSSVYDDLYNDYP